jgi:hypothetical protein
MKKFRIYMEDVEVIFAGVVEPPFGVEATENDLEKLFEEWRTIHDENDDWPEDNAEFVKWIVSEKGWREIQSEETSVKLVF